ncbi:hypothetical protein WJX82_005342 [Trebouxia sp. C0006]
MAENDGAEAAIYRPVDENQKQLDRTTLTSHDVEQLLSVIASMPDRLQAARARELILLNIQTGFRGCGIVEQSWGKLGLSSEAAIALVTKVLEGFGLTTKRGRGKLIVQQSAAFFMLRSTSADKLETRLLLNTGWTVIEFKKVYDEEVTLALNNLKHQAM